MHLVTNCIRKYKWKNYVVRFEVFATLTVVWYMTPLSLVDNVSIIVENKV